MDISFDPMEISWKCYFPDLGEEKDFVFIYNVCAHESSAHEGQERASDLPQQELQVIISYLV